MIKFLLLFLGGGIGTICRHGLYQLTPTSFWATLLVNILGSFLAGILYGIYFHTEIPDHWKTFVHVGLLGGFTTFSTFSLEMLMLTHDISLTMTILYGLANVAGGIVGAYTGFLLGRIISTGTYS